MKCPKCQELGLKSTLHLGGAIATLMCGDSYYDEDGNRHDHDPNETSGSWHCSQGHEGQVRYSNRCLAPDCTFGHDTVMIVSEAQVPVCCLKHQQLGRDDGSFCAGAPAAQ